MNYNSKPSTIVRRVGTVLSEDIQEVVEIVHTFCDGRSICASSEMLATSLSVTLGSFSEIGSTGIYEATVRVNGKVQYQPVNECGDGFTPRFDGYRGECAPCAAEDVIFASFKVYTDSDDFSVTASDAIVSAITRSACENYTRQVLIQLPLNWAD